MSPNATNPKDGASGSGKCSLRSRENTSPAPSINQAKLDLIVDDIVDTAGWLVDQLYVLPAQRAAADYSGMLYTLRRSRAYWRHISEVARELAAANDERLSALRQGEDVDHG
jgi:hypothetical protein